MKVAVTGAYGYSGRYIAQRLLDAGHAVKTLTNSPERPNPFEGHVPASPLDFDRPDILEASLEGVECLVNTYWIRLNHKLFNQREAVANVKVLFNAARAAGVRRIVHVSITNPDLHSPYPYFRGKAELEQALTSLGLSYCILRPAALFGREDILINNIVWGLKHLPVFGMVGKGDYNLAPIYVDDFAAAAAEKVTGTDDEIVNATGPDTFRYRDMVDMIKKQLGLHTPIVSVTPAMADLAHHLIGAIMNDVLLAREEIDALADNLLAVDTPPLGRTRLADWLAEHRETVGEGYTSELARRRDRRSVYRSN